MNRFRRAIPLLPLLAAALHLSCSSGAPARRNQPAASVRFDVSVPNPASETFSVTARIDGILRDTIPFLFPIWAPGAYDVVNFGAYVSGMTAIGADGTQLQVVRRDTNSFLIIGRSRSITLHYTVADIESSPNASWFGLTDVEPTFAFANAVALFGYPEGFKEIPYTVGYHPPPGWDMTVSLDPTGEPGTFHADGYDELVDAPVQMGTFQRFTFDLAGKPHTITVSAPDRIDPKEGARLAEATRVVVKAMTDFFEEIPYDRYIFQHYLVDLRKGGPRPPYGALEHAASSTYLLPYAGGEDIVALLRPIVAHEFWHVWFPKRIHVRQLGPFDYQKPPRTASLWFAEGLTEYYARVLLVRNRMQPWESFLAEMARDIGKHYGVAQARSITELSLQVASLPIGEVVDLYSKGPVIGLLLDAEIRRQTRNARSLDDAMRSFNREFGRTGKVFDDEDIIPVMERATGTKLREFYRRYIAGREPLPFDELLPGIGLRYQLLQQTRPTLGVELEQAQRGLRVTKVIPGGSADSMGIVVGDILLRMSTTGGRDISFDAVAAVAADELFGAVRPVTLVVLRNGAERLLRAQVVSTTVPVRALRADADATPEQVATRKSLFGY